MTLSPQLLSLLSGQNTSPVYYKHTVSEGDTVESIAQSLLGQAALWPLISSLNSLRSPYITTENLDHLSTDSLDQFDSPLLETSLPLGATAGDMIISLPPLLPFYFDIGDILIISQTDTTGILQRDILSITSVDRGLNKVGVQRVDSYNSISHILIQAPWQGLRSSYLPGTPVTLYPNPLSQTTAVAQPGDVLSVPIPARLQKKLQGSVISVTGIVPSPTGLLDYLGTDIPLDENGQIVVSAGDISSVSGPANLAQALRERLATDIGTLLHFPLYGTYLQRYVGLVAGPTLLTLAIQAIKDDLGRDPRVAQVTVKSSSLSTDTLSLNVEVGVSDSSTILALQNISFPLVNTTL